MTVGNLVAIAQTNIKRMLAYSSIAHAGYALICIVVGGSSGICEFAILYAGIHIYEPGCVCRNNRTWEKREKKYSNIEDLSGLGYKHPLLAVTMCIFMFSLAGIPPLVGFMGKFYIFSSAIKSGFLVLTIIGVVNSVISVYYYLRVTVVMYMKKPTREFAPLSLSPFILLALLITIWGTIFLGIFPSKIIAFAQKSSILF